MINRLSIDNYALIDKSEIDFHNGFTVITGETGSGKSIMLGALSLLMGTRADSKVLGNKDRKMVVEAEFSNPGEFIKKICEENVIDWYNNEIIIRREISLAGKSRGFVNDTPVNLNVLQKISENLLDIHSQHKNILLNQPSQQLNIIDSYGDVTDVLNEYKTSFKKYISLRNHIKNLKETIAKGKANKEYISFRLKQLDKIKPRKGELIELEREAEIQSDADRIKSSLYEAERYIEGADSSALKQIQRAALTLSNVDFNLLDPNNEGDIISRIEAIKIELRDIADTISEYNENIYFEPNKYEKLQDRIESLYGAMKDFKVKDEEELVDLYTSLNEEYSLINDENQDLTTLENNLKLLAKELKEQADNLTEERKKASSEFVKAVIKKIRPLGLPNVKFEVEVIKGKLTQEGQDTISFLCSFNKNHDLQPISEIASGGEMARMMLGIKSVMAEKMHLPTIIFDEIDTGVSGEIAHKMGCMMKVMGEKIQVLSVTHLPQVSAKADYHLKVYKKDNKEKTVSFFKELDEEERVREIAGMLSGNSINEASLENARMLMKAN